MAADAMVEEPPDVLAAQALRDSFRDEIPSILIAAAAIICPIVCLDQYLGLDLLRFVGVLLAVLFAKFLLERKMDAITGQIEARIRSERLKHTPQTPLESSLWLNKFLLFHWTDTIEPFLSNMLNDTINLALKDAKPTFISHLTLDSFSIGSTPPAISSVQVWGTGHEEVHMVELDVDFNAEDFRLMLRAVANDEVKLINKMEFNVKVTALGLKVRLRIFMYERGDLLSLSAIKPPDIYAFSSHLLGISPSMIPFFDIRQVVENAVADVLVDPNRVDVPFVLDYTLCPPVETASIRLQIVSCMDLRILSSNTMPRPQVQVKINNLLYQSNTARGANPHFKFQVEAEVDSSTGYLEIEIIVQDKANGNRTMGKTKVFVQSTYRNTAIVWSEFSKNLPLARNVGVNDASFLLSPPLDTEGNVKVEMWPVRWTYRAAAEGAGAQGIASPHVRREPHCFVLNVVQARHLEARDSGGTSDPYCTVKYGKTYTHKTKMRRKTVNPVWCDTFVIEQQHGVDRIDLSCFDHDRLSQDDSLGSTSIQTASFELGKKYKAWKKLEGVLCGELMYTIVLVKGTEESVKKSHVVKESFYAAEDSIGVNVFRGEALVPGNKDGTSDTYVVVSYGGAQQKSQKIKRTLKPEWDFRADFPFCEEGSDIRVVVYAYNAFSYKRPLGEAVIRSVEAIKPGGEIAEQWYELENTISGRILIRISRSERESPAEMETISRETTGELDTVASDIVSFLEEEWCASPVTRRPSEVPLPAAPLPPTTSPQRRHIITQEDETITQLNKEISKEENAQMKGLEDNF